MKKILVYIACIFGLICYVALNLLLVGGVIYFLVYMMLTDASHEEYINLTWWIIMGVILLSIIILLIYLWKKDKTDANPGSQLYFPITGNDTARDELWEEQQYRNSNLSANWTDADDWNCGTHDDHDGMFGFDSYEENDF